MPDIDLASISPVTDAEAARLASATAFADLARQITSVPVPADRLAAPGLAPRRRPRRPRRPRALLVGLPVAALAGVAALLVTVLGTGGSPVGSIAGGTAGRTAGSSSANSPAAIQALAFVKKDGYITVIIRNPYADASWYNADFARHHMDIKLDLLAASPSFVGTIEAMSADSSATMDEITTITKPGSCGIDGTTCTIGFKVPLSFHGQATIEIGRPARPGEQYQTAGSPFNRGEALYGLEDQVYGHPLSQVLPLLARHHVTIAVLRGPDNTDMNVSQAPPAWYIENVVPWAPNEVIAWIGPQPSVAVPAPATTPNPA